MWQIILTTVIFACGVSCESPREDWKVIVIMIDGCRWDYVNDTGLKGFPKLAKYGVKAKYVKPVFPSNSYPNWYSIVTGLYSESHGFVQNIMYDDQLEDFFLMLPNTNSTDSHWWEQAEPLWVNAVKNGVKTAMYWWGGCEVEIHGVRPTLCLKHRYTAGGENVSRDITIKLGEILNKFHRNEIRLAMLYYGAVDYTGHYNGPDSSERKTALLEIDRVLDDFQDQIYQRGLSDQVNIIIVSDHGMTNTDPNIVHEIDLEKFADDIKYMLFKGSSAMILPEDGKLNKLYNALKKENITGLQIFKKEDIPVKYHFKNNRLVLPLFVLANKGYYIKQLADFNKTRSDSTSVYYGYHGYDPDEVEDMNTIFYARGPALRRNYTCVPLENVDHYNLICNILGITPRSNNGSWNRIKEMFSQPVSTNDKNSSFTVNLSSLIVLLMCASWWIN